MTAFTLWDGVVINTKYIIVIGIVQAEHDKWYYKVYTRNQTPPYAINVFDTEQAAIDSRESLIELLRSDA